ncbi:MAG: hypothetical protein FD161_4685 [Limisphaerales bacterium]|nr:MAG: hypothetical protein FD161_4685 [Limisphaerales bacterium]KAG0506716.1 MAG: hypothetical protein E1N63_4126 [Limisphaerales bacterium]TXT45194.1 MAG: hypothetical protein FD140_4746 [Limisphaerales bacterium]
MFRGYAWSYFAYHADQRMKTFNFFLVAAGLFAGGVTTMLRDGGDPRWVCPLGIVLTLLSLTFWKLDQRNRHLVRNAEAALKYLDTLHEFPHQDGVPHVLRIFDRDDYFSERAQMFPLTQGRFSYTKCLGVVFALFALLGLFFAVGSLVIHKPPPMKTQPCATAPFAAGPL